MKCKCKSQPVLFFAFFAMCTRFCYICYQNCELRVSKSLIPVVILHFLSLRGLKYSEVQCNNLKVYLALIVLTSLINPSLTDSWWENTNMAHSNAPVSELTKLSFPVQTVKQPFTTAWMLHYFFVLFIKFYHYFAIMLSHSSFHSLPLILQCHRGAGAHPCFRARREVHCGQVTSLTQG